MAKMAQQHRDQLQQFASSQQAQIVSSLTYPASNAACQSNFAPLTTSTSSPSTSSSLSVVNSQSGSAASPDPAAAAAAAASGGAGTSGTVAAPGPDPAMVGPGGSFAYIDRKAAQIPSKYDGKDNVESWISSMQSYFDVLGTPPSTQSSILGTNVEPVVRGFLETEVVQSGYKRIDLNKWLKATPTTALEDLLIKQYADPHAAAKARLKLDKLKHSKWTGTMHSLQQYVSKLFATPDLEMTAQSCLDVIKGTVPSTLKDRLGLGLSGYTNWLTLMRDLVKLEAQDLPGGSSGKKATSRKRFQGSNRFAAHDLLEADEENLVDESSLDDDQEQDCGASCSLSAHESEYVNDEESMFISADWKDFTSQTYDMKLKMTSGRHPEANGLAEEINQTVIQLLRALIVPDQNSWDEELPIVQGLYNNSIHSSTGMTPNRLHLGWKIRNPLSYLFHDHPPGLTPGQPGYSAKFDRLLKVVVTAMERRRSAMIKHANKKRQPAPFTVGSYVWVKMYEFSEEEGVSRRLLPQHYGPWQVLKQVATDVSFAILTVGDKRMLARTVREEISEDYSLGFFGIPLLPTKDPVEPGQEPDSTKPFEPILIRMEEKAKLREGLVWRAWNTVTALPYSTLASKMCPTEVMAESLASIIRSRILATEKSLHDEAEALYVELEDEDEGFMDGNDDDDALMDGKISPNSEDRGSTPAPEGSTGGYSEDNGGTRADNAKKGAAED
ncbi:hypothetical protein CBR_g17914 [Chara braunii]|uniref:Integrase catalytic domain-containing protein n=1 Tax=Chara braunii TaxID=69332 RepID=A0A388KW41_CHABU|nr:hypothetical protein CBR_g17914 [Chara braunii]|eukprot:GBG74202.1 hypothetical protein CBR_g17914 [Chara braunii]